MNKRELLIYGAAAASIGYIFSIASGSIGLMLLLASWLLNYKNISFKNIRLKNELVLPIIFFLFFAISISWSVNWYQGQKEVVRFLGYLLIPLVFLTVPSFNSKERNKVFRIFIHSLSLFFVVCLITAIIRQIGFYNRGGIFNWYYFYRYDFLEIFDQHPTYVSMFTLLSLSVLLTKGKKVISSKVFLTATIILQTVAIILYGSRMGYILFLLLSGLWIFRFLRTKTKQKRIGYSLVFIITTGVFLFGIWNIPIVKERILYTLGYDYEYQFNNKENVIDSTPEEKGRLLLWTDVVELIKEKPVLGHGAGSGKQVLLKKYKEKQHVIFFEEQYNAHNTYLEFWLQGGIFLMLLYMGLLTNIFKQSLKNRNSVLFAFGLIITLTSLTESIFIAQGILFFSFFYSFLIRSSYE